MHDIEDTDSFNKDTDSLNKDRMGQIPVPLNREARRKIVKSVSVKRQGRRGRNLGGARVKR